MSGPVVFVAYLMRRGDKHHLVTQGSVITDHDRCVEIKEAININDGVMSNTEAAADIAETMHVLSLIHI